MISNFSLRTYVLWISTVLVLLVPAWAGEPAANEVQLMRDLYQVDRKAFIMENLEMNEAESARFWPIYEQYRAEMEKTGDQLVKLILEYAELYPTVPDQRAKELLKQYTKLDGQLASIRKAYLKKAAKVLSPAKVLRWAQLENRMDLALRLQLAGAIPLAGGKRNLK